MSRRERIPQLDFREDERRREAMRRDRRYDDIGLTRGVQDRILDDYMRQDRDEVVREMINNPDIIITPELTDLVNDPEVVVTPDNVISRRSAPRTRSSRFDGRFGSQFNIGMGFDLPPSKSSSRSRKKTSNDSRMSKALKQANARLRLKSGKLRKGKTMRDVMRLAHKLAKK